MIFRSRFPITVPPKDILSYIFDGYNHGWDRPVFIDAESPDQQITARQLLNYTKKIGYGLQKLAGVSTGDVVLICAPNRLFTPSVMLGILCCGGIISGANPYFLETELMYQIRDSKPKAIFADSSTLDKVRKCLSSLECSRPTIFLLSTSEERTGGPLTISSLLKCGEMEWERLSSLEEMKNRLAALNYSSGTTGLPKGCEITVFNFVAHCTQSAILSEEGRKRMGLRRESYPEFDKQIVFVPFYHSMGQQLYCVHSVKAGHVTYVMDGFNFEKLLTYIPRYKITNLALVPPIALLFAKNGAARSADLSSLRSVCCGAAPLGVESQKQAESAISRTGHVRIQQAWGMTECTLGATTFLAGEYDPGINGVGYLIPGMSATIVDEDGRELGYDMAGEILLKGPNIFRGYWKNDEATKSSFTKGGWYKTGDIGVMKHTGILYIVDRKKELIKVKGNVVSTSSVVYGNSGKLFAGYQVAPAELETLLLQHVDVRDAAVIGISREGTELLRAYIVPKGDQVDPSGIKRFVEQRVTRYKHLTGGIVIVQAIPRSASGKILRRVLRERVQTHEVPCVKL